MCRISTGEAHHNILLAEDLRLTCCPCSPKTLPRSHGEGEGSGRGPGDEEGPPQGDEGAQGHEVSWGGLLRLVRSGSPVRAPAPACGCLHRVVERGPHGAPLWAVEHGLWYIGSVYAHQ